jgi:hypothetical protein
VNTLRPTPFRAARLNQWALSGQWTIKGEAAALNVPAGGSHTDFTRAIST